MEFTKYQYSETEKVVIQLDDDEDRIDYLDDELLQCRNAIYNVEKHVSKVVYESLNLGTANSALNEIIDTGMKQDAKFRGEIITSVIDVIVTKTLDGHNQYYEQCTNLKKRFMERIELKLKTIQLKESGLKQNKQILGDDRIRINIEPILILQIFEKFCKCTYLPEYTPDQILVHFKNDKGKKLNMKPMEQEYLQWLKSDNLFAVFVDELAQRGIIDDVTKFTSE